MLEFRKYIPQIVDSPSDLASGEETSKVPFESHRNIVNESTFSLPEAKQLGNSEIRLLLQDREIGNLFAVAISAIGPSPVFKGPSIVEKARQEAQK